MSEATLQFLTHFQIPSGQFNTPVPIETPYERMVREFEAGAPNMLETMKLVVPKDSTEAEELARWKQWAVEERSCVRSSVQVRHKLVPLRSTLGPKFGKAVRVTSDDFVAFYGCLDSARLFVPGNEPEGGLIFYPSTEHPDQLDYVRDWLEQDEEDFEESMESGELEFLGTPPWLEACVAFAGIGQSAERFLLACDGPYRGSVLAFDHDPLGMRIVAPSFEAFLRTIIGSPLLVANWVGIHDADRYDEAVA